MFRSSPHPAAVSRRRSAPRGRRRGKLRGPARTRGGTALGLGGPPPVLPRPLDAVARRWAGLPPRVRTLLVLTAVAALLAGTRVQVLRAESRWGGSPVEAWVAVADSPVGAVPELERVRLPPRAVPPRVAAPTGVPLAVALPEGAVLTELHLSAAGPAVGLPPGERLVPIPVDEGWGVTAGARVDVWVQAAEGRGPRRVGAARPVLDVRTDDAGRRTALVGMAGDEVAAVTSGIAGGGVLLSIVPGSVPSATP